MPVIYSNNASTTLSSGINDSTTTIAISSASGFPSISGSNYYFATLANTNNTKIEIVKVTAGTTSLTVVRAQDGTSAQAFDSGDNFQVRVTTATLEAATKTDVNITGGAIAGAAITNDVIDSQHYADGSIDLAHLSADCVDGTKIADDSINSEHYVDASIDTAHIGDDQVTADKLANSINTDIATGVAALPKAGGAMTGAITTNSTFDGRDVATDGTKLDGIASSANNYTHPNHSGEVTSTADGATVIADNIVDEANLKVSNAPTNGYFLSAQSGNTGGMTWAAVSSEDFIPNGSVMAFFQASAPTGWTQVTTQNDKVLRVVSGTGGGTGGTWAVNGGVTTSEVGAHSHTSAAHTHTSAAHTHSHSLSGGAHTLSTAQIPSHSHTAAAISGDAGGSPDQTVTSGNTGNTGSGASHTHSVSGSISSTTPGATGSTTPGATGSANAHSHTITSPQYIDMIICSKDA